MKFFYPTFLFLLLTSCSELGKGKHLNEKVFKSGDITVKWYQTSAITSVHDFIDVERSGHTETIMEANTGGIYDVLIKGDTITIQAKNDLLIYQLTSRNLSCTIKLDTSITMCQYMKKYGPEYAKYYCDEDSTDGNQKR